MFPVTVQGQSLWLIPFGPNTDDPVTIKARIEVDAQRGLTGRMSRRPQAFTLRYRLQWTSLMRPAEFAAARSASLAMQDQYFLAPFWPAARATSAAAPLVSGLTVAWTAGWTAFAVNPGSLAGYDFFAPLLWGRFKQPPRLAAKSTDYILAEFSFDEDASAANTISAPAGTDATFATASGFAAAVWPFVWDPEKQPKPALGTVDVDHQSLGPGRQATSVFYPQTPEQGLQISCKFASSAAAFALLGWWQRRAGGADPFWAPGSQQLAYLAADAAAAATTLATQTPLSAQPGESLALLTTAQPPELARVSAVAGNTVTLAAALAAAHPAQTTLLATAFLARHTDAELSIDFRRADTDWLAEATVAVREAAAEYAPPADETRGLTIGRLPATAWLFRIDLDYSGAVQSWFLTNWESGCTTPDGQVWAYQDCDFDKLTQSLDLEDDSCTFKIRWWAGCPFQNWLPGQLSATGKLTILRAPVSSAGAVGAGVTLWQGVLSTPDREGPLYSIKVLGANNVFSRNCPRQLMSPSCATQLFSPRCGLSLAAWSFAGVIAAISGQSITVGSFPGSLPAGFGAQDWFALGWLQWTDGSGHPLRAEVLSSSALAGGQIVFQCARSLGWAVGAAVTCVPGCDRQVATCQNKFSNLTHFRGFPFMPAVSPSFILPAMKNTPAKK